MKERKQAATVWLTTLLDEVQLLSGRDIEVPSCTCDWRLVQPGDLFIAVTESCSDGHDDVEKAIDRGAAGIVCERPLPYFSTPQAIVPDSRAAYACICQALMGAPSQHVQVIGIAGTSGKSMIAHLTTEILRQASYRPVNITPAIESLTQSASQTDTPSPLPAIVARLMAEAVANQATHVILELAAEDLASLRYEGVTLNQVCIATIGRDMAGQFGSQRNYREIQRRTLSMLSEDALAIFNADDPAVAAILAECDTAALTFGTTDSAEIQGQVLEQHVGEQTFLLAAGTATSAIQTTIPGDQHVTNALAAASVCLAAGVDLVTISRGLESATPIPGHMEPIACGQPFSVVVDRADSPERLLSAARSLRKITPGRLICVLSGVEGSPRSDRRLLGRILTRRADMTFITSGLPVHEDPAEVTMEVFRGFDQHGQATIMLDREDAIAAAIAAAEPGDTILLAGLGDETWQPPTVVSGPRNDRQLTEAILRGTPANSPEPDRVA